MAEEETGCNEGILPLFEWYFWIEGIQNFRNLQPVTKRHIHTQKERKYCAFRSTLSSCLLKSRSSYLIRDMNVCLIHKIKEHPKRHTYSHKPCWSVSFAQTPQLKDGRVRQVGERFHDLCWRSVGGAFRNNQSARRESCRYTAAHHLRHVPDLHTDQSDHQQGEDFIHHNQNKWEFIMNKLIHFEFINFFLQMFHAKGNTNSFLHMAQYTLWHTRSIIYVLFINAYSI